MKRNYNCSNFDGIIGRAGWTQTQTKKDSIKHVF